MGGQAMIEFRIAENRRKFYIEHLDGKFWRLYEEPHVPKYFDSLADARSWVATIKRGVVYHDVEAPRVYNDAEDATNLAQDERKAEEITWYSVMPSNGKIDIEMSEVVAVFKDEYEAVAYGKKRYGSVFWVLPHHDPR
jgi:hypothetical protein